MEPAFEYKGEANPEEVEAEILDKAGNRTLEESQELMAESTSLLEKRQRDGEKRICHADTVDDINTAKGTNSRGEKVEMQRFQEGGVGYAKINGGEMIMTSDIHGGKDNLTVPLKEFLERVAKGENVYFSCSGDITNEGNDKLGSLEALLAAQQKYPDRVFITPGNADRRGTSLFVGLVPEISQKYLPAETFEDIEKETESILKRLWQEQKEQVEKELEGKPDDQKLKKRLEKINEFATKKEGRRMDYDMIFGAVLMQAARHAGAEPFDAKQFATRQIYFDFKDLLGIEGKSTVLENSLGRALISATRKIKNPERKIGNPEEIKRVFELWRGVDKVLNKLPTMQIIDTPQGRMMVSHTQPAKIDSLSPYVYNPVDQQEALWHRYNPEIEGINEGKGHHTGYGPDVVAKFATRNKIALAQFGHTHANRQEVLESDGHKVMRLELATSHRDKKNGPHYARVNLNRLDEVTGHPENVIEQVKI
ncbi:MAG: hypothetical protein COY66_02790 [Candidatus Kerfeldbacteria bacterium CG_4_10_14_0_8_um_filter_42_10]|uniref:Calcineurin-like phosphoesterase domain-containing protein n=1 Tax=Candidatus Kerfeldbacteria bacterium CG_4_10_14_0_8_um_filter_42_10 TaxID=2014248 RepID=A0A2M7RJ94_9BACT|nr:MAG: hypothetical protein COY66_02790 [Candidatus Kerfeldbacteria bacterium CG_4_10_14_0_8_um_filter_42_10]